MHLTYATKCAHLERKVDSPCLSVGEGLRDRLVSDGARNPPVWEPVCEGEKFGPLCAASQQGH